MRITIQKEVCTKHKFTTYVLPHEHSTLLGFAKCQEQTTCAYGESIIIIIIILV